MYILAPPMLVYPKGGENQKSLSQLIDAIWLRPVVQIVRCHFDRLVHRRLLRRQERHTSTVWSQTFRCDPKLIDLNYSSNDA